jgi:hypothetical protein
MGLLKLIYGHEIFKPRNLPCMIVAFVIQWTSRVEIFNVAVLSTLRYLIVWYKKELKLWIWLLILFISTLFITIIYSIGIYIGDASPSPSYLYCQPFTTPNDIQKVMTFLIPFTFLIPCWITTFCYFGVGYKANQQLNIVKQDAINNCDEVLLGIVKQQKIKLIIQLLFVFIIYNVNFSLSYVTWILKFAIGYKRPPEIDASISISVNFTVAINPVITIIFQPDINNEIKFIFVKFKLKCKKFIANIITRQ